jgi:hypothetical protein
VLLQGGTPTNSGKGENMGRPRTQTMVARDACVVVVGARPIEYGKVTVTHNKTGEQVTIDNQNDVVDAGSQGTSYVFKPLQKVSSNHPAVKDSPSSFMPLEEVDEADLEFVKSA